MVVLSYLYVVVVYDWGIDGGVGVGDGVLYLVMEYLVGGSLWVMFDRGCLFIFL